LKKLLLFIIVFGLIGGLLWNFSSETKYQSFISQVVDSTATKRINFTVEKGERVKNIGKELETKEIINSAWAFYRYVKESGLGPEIEAGRFLLKQSYTIPEIAEMLTRSSISEVAITIREGLTIKQIDEYLAKEKVLSAGAFGECAKNCELDYGFLGSRPRGHDLEGYLFPDTYYIELEGITAKKVIQKMLNKQRNILNPLTEGWHFHLHNFQTIIKVLPEFPQPYLFFQIPVRTCDNTDISLYGNRLPHPLKFSFFKNPQKFELYSWRYISDFIQQNRSAGRDLETAPGVIYGTSKRTFHMAEKFAFKQVFG